MPRMVFLLPVLALLLAWIPAAQAATIVVNVFTDSPDLNAGAGACDSDGLTDNPCSLRAVFAWYAPENRTYFWRVRAQQPNGAWSVVETFTVEA